ncbi:hypothetical protein SAMN05216315_103155 [Nitrosospira sp. Nsp18]|uniref:hypothetical protein n=1 Tax=Nitrosospira sp. Nsp18 TaxID=1855334 RepID=UPI00087E6B56|nr:hypothetical protein [Nitrosospira sp. Nsp18]SDA12735.1 hypothetical protein SAMN05216315_103155 [Nitrosospira sp. Nsp18]
MDVNRRNLMKGALTGGTLLALGIPAGAFAIPPRRAEKFGLLLGNTPVDAAFAAGFRSAAQYSAKGGGVMAAGAGEGNGSPQVVKLKGGLLSDYEIAARLLEKSRGTRWVAVMDSGSAAVFTELVRNAGARLLLLGSHVSSDHDPSKQGIFPDIARLRHVWAAASPAHTAGAILASQLIGNQGSFSITENFFSAEHSATQAQTDSATTDGFAPGFLSYRLDGPDAIHLHCSGLSLSNGCESLGWSSAGRCAPVSQQAPMHGAIMGTGRPQSAGWVESVGYAVMAAALGTGALQESCSSRAFVHRSALGNRGERIDATEFTSFVIDI